MAEDKNIVWTRMESNRLWYRIVWYLDKRLFRWDHLPSLAQLRIIRKSYLLLIILPIIDKFLSPIITAPDGLKIALDMTWITVLPEGSKIAVELGIPFTWKCVYFLVLFVASGSILYELWCPPIVKGELPRQPTKQLILQEFRKTAMQLFSAKRMNHFMNNFLENYASNYDALQNTHPEEPDAKPLPDAKSNERLDTKSLYFIAERMNISDEKVNDAIETIIWFANEARAIARWFSGTLFCAAIGLFLFLMWQGFYQIVR